MKRTLSKRLKKYLPFVSLPLILLVCFVLWVNLPEEHYASVYSRSGIWDLREFDFETAVASIHGPVEYIPVPFLTPEEFASRADEISLGHPVIGEPATVRVRFILPYDEYYAITRISTGYADRVYVNGQWLRDIGSQEKGVGDILFSPIFTFAARPENGVIEILHQQSNFIYHVRGIYRDGSLPVYNYGNDYWRVAYTTNIVLGIFLAMAVVSLLLSLFSSNYYRPALFFALSCIAWFVYTGAMGSRAFVTIAPWYTDPLRISLAFIISPATTLLSIAIIRELFPKLLHRYFVRGAAPLMAAFIIYFIFADIANIPDYVLWVVMGIPAVCAIYALVLFAINFRKLNLAQGIFAVGELVMFYAGVRDILTYIPLSIGGYSLLLPPFDGTNLARIGVIASLFCQFAAVFMATSRERENYMEREQRLAAENAALDSLARMKTEFLADISHEIKTPLTVISGNVQQAVRLYGETGGENSAIYASLLEAKDEILRLARLTENSLRLASMQESHGKMQALDVSKLIANSAGLHRHFIEKQGNAFSVKVENDLPSILGNADQLIQVMANLLSNANAHTRGGAIAVDAREDDGYIAVTVTDNGVGIAQELLPCVFERGVTDGGTGLGLSISRDIIEAHGGSISITSEQGKGTKAIFRVPVLGKREGPAPV